MKIKKNFFANHMNMIRVPGFLTFFLALVMVAPPVYANSSESNSLQLDPSPPLTVGDVYDDILWQLEWSEQTRSTDDQLFFAKKVLDSLYEVNPGISFRTRKYSYQNISVREQLLADLEAKLVVMENAHQFSNINAFKAASREFNTLLRIALED